jgi:hypothetical protein
MVSVAPRSHPDLPARDYAADREAIPTACGRMVERLKREARTHLYRLWEPVLAGSTYRVTRNGGTWGLACARRPPSPLTDIDRIYHDLAEQRRAMSLLRATVGELGLRAEAGRPSVIYEATGDLLLFSDPEVCAGLAMSQRLGARRTT